MEEQVEEESVKRPPWWKRLWEWTDFGKRTGWNWLELLSALAIPVVLAVAGLWFSAQQDRRQVDIEAQRAESARKVEEQRAQDAALQAYLDQMGQLLLEEDLRDPEAKSEARTLARARTLTVLVRIDSSRKSEVMRFLVEANLVQGVVERDPIIGLGGAGLSGADLGSADLEYAYLSDADLSDADLEYAYLSGADLSGADLPGANLEYADLGSADLSDADLSDADLRSADLGAADLSRADLSDAYLGSADLSDADLRDAVGITNDELEQQAQSLEGASMPDGSKHP